MVKANRPGLTTESSFGDATLAKASETVQISITKRKEPSATAAPTRKLRNPARCQHATVLQAHACTARVTVAAGATPLVAAEAAEKDPVEAASVRTARATTAVYTATEPHPVPRPVHACPLPPVYRQQMATVPTSAVAATSKPQQSATSDELLEAELRAFLQDANLGGDLSLCEYKEWASRRQYCNLVVLVCGTQFNLHKHPMLLESYKLHRMARQMLETSANNNNFGGAVPVLELAAFPGGAEMFETLAIYCYTGEISFSLANLAAMNCAIEFLEMRDDIRQSAKRFLDQQISRGSKGMSNLLQLFTLSSELFVELTQRVLSSNVPASATARSTAAIASELCVQAKLAQLHRDAQRSLSPSHCNRILAQQCVQLLQGESVETVDAIKAEKMETACEEPLGLTMLLTSEQSDKMLIKLMDDDLSACAVSPSSPRLDASVYFASDNFRFGTHTLPETFVV
ncbi:SKP1/BTB/POZ domain [Phytophthora cactorum]|nr:SKP1/BTB/POZ domain [Phytophthora cactorum]